MNEQTKQNPFSTLKSAYLRHERKILVATTVLSTAGAVAMRSSVAQHNAFLKEHGLFEQFYNINQDV